MTGIASVSKAETRSISARRAGSRRKTAIALAVGAITALGTIRLAHGATLFWDADGSSTTNNTSGAGIGGNGTWTTTSINWWNSSTGTAGPDVAWVSADQAEITGAANSTLTLGSNITVGGGILSFVAFTIGGSPNVLTLAGNVQISGPASTISAPIAGTGFSSSVGTLVLSGANTFTGTYTLTSGQVNLNNATALGTSTFVITAGNIDSSTGSTLTLTNNNAQTWNGNFTFIGSNSLNMGTGGVTLGTVAGTSRTITTNASTLTIGGIISNGTTANSLIKAGAGTLALTGNNTFTGGVTVNAGTLVMSGNNSFTGTAALNAGILVLSGSNTYAGGTTVSGGTLDINNGGTSSASAIGTGPLTIAGGNIDNNSAGGVVLATNNVQTWNNDFTFFGSQNLDLGNGAVSLGTTAGTTRTVTVNASTLTVDGVISNGTTVNSLTKAGAGTLILTGAGAYTGVTTIAGGTLSLSSTATLASSSLVMDGGVLLLDPNQAGLSFASGTTLTSASGSAIVANYANGATLALNAITRNPGTAVDFTLPTNGTVTTTTANASFAGGQQTILGGYATVGGTTWAVSGSGATAGAISPLSAYSSSFTAGADVDAPTSPAAPGTMTINSLRFNNAGSTVPDSGSGDTLTIASGGILETANVGGNSVTISPLNLTSGNGSDLILNQYNTNAPMTINSNVTGNISLTKIGPGALILNGSNNYTGTTYLSGSGSVTENFTGNLNLSGANNTTFTGGLILNGGTATYTGDANLGAAGNTVTVNGATINFTGTTPITDTKIFSITGSGGTFNIPTPGGIGGKITFTAAGLIPASGTVTKTGPGWLSISGANTGTGNWIINAGVIEAKAGALGSPTSITINGDDTTNPNTSGELAANNTTFTNFIILNGGVLSSDNGTSTYSGNINVQANSTIRLGDFYGATNRSLTISGTLFGSGNLTLANSLSNLPTNSYLGATNQILTLSNSGNGGYSGTLTVDAGHGVLFTQIGAELSQIVATSSTTAMPIIAQNFDLPSNTQTPVINTVNASTGVFALGGFTSSGNDVINLSTLYGGGWYLGGDINNVSYDGHITPATIGTVPTYRLGGGDGSLFIGNTNEVAQQAGTTATNVIIGATLIGGTGQVRYGNAMSPTGTTTVNGGSALDMDFNATGTLTNLLNAASPLVLNGGAFTITGKNSVSLSQTVNGVTINPGGGSSIQNNATTTANPSILKLGAITRNVGGTVDFVLPTGTQSNTTNGITTTTANTANAILGGWATVSGSSWAVSAGTGSALGLISALPAGSYSASVAGTTAPGTTADVDFQASNTTPWTAQTINSLRFNTATAGTLTLASNTLTVSSGGILETTTVGANATTITGGTLEGAAGTDLIVIQNNTNAAGTLTINSTIADNSTATGLTKSGGGALIVGAANTFTGLTSDNGGSITLTNSLALQNSTLSTSIVAGSVSFSTLTSVTLGGLSGNQLISLTNTAGTATALTVGGNNASTTYGGNLSGSGSVTKVGTGGLTLSGINSYAGTTTVNGGTLRVNGTLTGTGAVAINAGTILAGTGAVTGAVAVAGGSTPAAQGSISLEDGGIGTLTLNNSLTFGGSSAGNPSNLAFDINASTADTIATNSLTANPGGATINVNSLVPGTSISTGMTYTLMAFNSSTGLTTGTGTTVGSLTLANPILTFGVTGSLNVTASAVQVVTSVTSAPSTAYWSGVQGAAWTATDATVTDGNFTTDPAGQNFVHAYPASNTDVIFSASGNGAPTNLTNTLGQNFDINSLTFQTGNPATTIGGAQQLTIEGGGITLQSNAGAVTLSMASLVLDQSQSWTNNSTAPLTVTSAVSGSGGLTTAGTVNMTGTNNYSGGTTVSSGTLQLGGGGSLNSTGNLTVNGTLDMNGSNVSSGTLSGTNSAAVITNGPAAANNVTLTTNVTSDSSFAGVISDSGVGKTLSMVKNGTNSLTLSGSNSYTGSTTLNSGTLVTGNPTALGNGGAVTINAGTLDLAATGGASGGARAISIGSLSGPGGTITDNNGNAGVTTLNVNQSVAGAYIGTLTDGSSRQVALSKSGTAVLTLTNVANSYSGGTTITSGKLLSVAPGSIGSGQVTLSGGTLSLGQLISGFGSNGTGWTTNQAGTYSNVPTPITANVLTLTDGTAAGNQGRWAFYNTPQSITDAGGFTANFVYTPSAGANTADGIAFVVQNDPRGPNVKNGTGGSLGVTSTANAGAVVFNLFQSGAAGVSQTGFNPIAGSTLSASPVNMSTGGINLHSGDSFAVSLSYSGSTLNETVTDQSNPADTFSTSYTGVDFQSLLGGTGGYVGFTGSDGGSVSTQTVSNFSFQSSLNTWSNNVLAAAGTTSDIELGVGAVGIGSLTIQPGATLSLSKANVLASSQVLTTTGLSIAGATDHWTGKLDLANNDLDVKNGSLAQITNQVKQGFNAASGGNWQGSGGITSSAAAADPTHLTALGTILNTADGINPIYSTFDGAPAAATDVLVKYTYYGDANLSGSVDGSDYSLIDNGFLNHLTGWYNGDFNYDGVVNGSDYTLIDNAFNSQGASLAAQIAGPTAELAGSGGSSVPEPASLALLGLGAVGLLGRRRAVRRSR